MLTVVTRKIVRRPCHGAKCLQPGRVPRDVMSRSSDEFNLKGSRWLSESVVMRGGQDALTARTDNLTVTECLTA
jgi:hypothetical protein